MEYKDSGMWRAVRMYEKAMKEYDAKMAIQDGYAWPATVITAELQKEATEHLARILMEHTINKALENKGKDK